MTKVTFDAARDAIFPKNTTVLKTTFLKEYGLTQLDVDEIRAKYTE
ncbi:MAG: hypothetical protein L6V85_03120 [Clostridiales bacterium]|nr:MAG: hypothetical protein L6V85_03120 [Clostridiales bacterium]